MLKVQTHIKESAIAGFGLFASQFIPKGTIIWQFNVLVDKTIPVSNLQYLSDIERKFLDTYGYREDDRIIICSDNGRYINHSKNPNTIDTIDSKLGSITTAARDIEIGEEIVSDYESFDADYNNYKY